MNPKNTAHIGVLRVLDRFKIKDLLRGYEGSSKDHNSPLTRGTGLGLGLGSGKGLGKEGNNNKYDAEFLKLWDKYPRKLGKGDAYRHYRASVKTPEDLESIKLALDNYLKYLEINHKEPQYMKHGSTWFNEWHDWIEYESEEEKEEVNLFKEF